MVDVGDVNAEDLAGRVDVEEGRFGQGFDAGVGGEDQAQVLGLVVPTRFGIGEGQRDEGRVVVEITQIELDAGHVAGVV